MLELEHAFCLAPAPRARRNALAAIRQSIHGLGAGPKHLANRRCQLIVWPMTLTDVAFILPSQPLVVSLLAFA